MNKFYSVIISGLLLSSSVNATNWNTLNLQQIPQGITQNVPARNMELFSIDLNSLKSQMLKAGYSPQEGIVISIPSGQGTTTEFKVWRTDVLAPSLQLLYPDIMTFTGYALNNQAVTAKLDITQWGFRALIYDFEKGSYYIDPYSQDRTDIYAGYFQKDIDNSKVNSGVCGLSSKESITQGTSSQINLGNTTPNTALKPHGSVKKKYRLAISCTGEYAQLVGGAAPTVSSVLSVIASTINRTNGFFEREIAVTMELIPENNSIVYIDPGSDPYTCNGDNSCLINEVQTNLNAVFGGSSNYDIGHIFNTAGGGLAMLAAMCEGSAKARGVSGTSGTTDIGTIIHEMGHQMGANHTFNSNKGDCDGNNNESTSYESGSGTSVMSYNGKCAPDDLAPPTAYYYHVHTLSEISTFLTSGGGSSCGTSMVGYTPISIMALGMTYNIPKNTPFELIGTNPTYGEPAPPAITFSWEQYDLGNPGGAESASSSWEVGPIFESLAPKVVKDRQFPKNSLVAENNYSSIGNRLPTVARQMKFKLTNRSYFEGWGTFNFSNDHIKVNVLEQTPFRIKNLNTPGTLAVGASQLITWDTGSTRLTPILCGYVSIHMSIDGGETFPYIITANAPNIGYYTFAVPNVFSTQVRFKVKAVSNIFYDISKANMTINGTFTSVEDVSTLKSVSIFPNPAMDKITVTNTDNNNKMNVVIYSITGQVVYNNSFQSETNIDLSSLAKGLYMVKVTDEVTGNNKIEKLTLK